MRVELLLSLPDASSAFVPSMHCKLVDQLPSGKEWLYELKLDGYRALLLKTEGCLQLISRNQKEYLTSARSSVYSLQQSGLFGPSAESISDRGVPYCTLVNPRTEQFDVVCGECRELFAAA
jgi:hypothetical protein